uniref:hypothetical protein n=1 Tax=Serratia fonticola TaxID=47917 RepID=UPI0005643212
MHKNVITVDKKRIFLAEKIQRAALDVHNSASSVASSVNVTWGLSDKVTTRATWAAYLIATHYN